MFSKEARNKLGGLYVILALLVAMLVFGSSSGVRITSDNASYTLSKRHTIFIEGGAEVLVNSTSEKGAFELVHELGHKFDNRNANQLLIPPGRWYVTQGRAIKTTITDPNGGVVSVSKSLNATNVWIRSAIGFVMWLGLCYWAYKNVVETGAQIIITIKD